MSAQLYPHSYHMLSSLSDVSGKLLAGAVKCLLFSTSACILVTLWQLPLPHSQDCKIVRSHLHSVKLSFKADMASMLSFEIPPHYLHYHSSCLRDDSSSCLDFSSSSKSASISFDFSFTFSKNPCHYPIVPSYTLIPQRILLLCSQTLIYSATQNVFKYTQTHRKSESLADTSYCFDVYAGDCKRTLLTSSCTLHSRKFLR